MKEKNKMKKLLKISAFSVVLVAMILGASNYVHAADSRWVYPSDGSDYSAAPYKPSGSNDNVCNVNMPPTTIKNGLKLTFSASVAPDSTHVFNVNAKNITGIAKTITYRKFTCRCDEQLGDLYPDVQGCYEFWPEKDTQEGHGGCKYVEETATIPPYRAIDIPIKVTQFLNQKCGSFQTDLHIMKINGVPLSPDGKVNTDTLHGFSSVQFCNSCPPPPPPECKCDADCGEDGFVGSPYCKDGDVFQDFKKNICKNPGTPEARCKSVIEKKLRQECLDCENCSDGECVEKQIPPKPVCDGKNLIKNPSVEGDSDCADGWHKGWWGAGQADFVYPSEGMTGKGATVNFSCSAWRTPIPSSDAKWYFDDVPVIPGKQYLFSDFYKANVPTYLTARYTLLNGLYYYVDLGVTDPADSWRQVSRTFTVPYGVASMTMFHLIRDTGSLSADDFFMGEPCKDEPSGKGMVSFDFDDGYQATWQNGLPIMDTYGIKTTQYIISGALGEYGYITREEMLDMQNQGHEIAAHSKTHPSLLGLSPADMTEEIAGSKRDLEAMGVSPITSFAYPFGEWDAAVKNVVEQSGYLGARTATETDGGYNRPGEDPYLLKTMSVEADTPVQTVKQWIDETNATGTWLILVFHQIENNGGQYSTTPAHLEEIAKYASDSGIKTVTTDEGLSLMAH